MFCDKFLACCGNFDGQHAREHRDVNPHALSSRLRKGEAGECADKRTQRRRFPLQNGVTPTLVADEVDYARCDETRERG